MQEERTDDLTRDLEALNTCSKPLCANNLHEPALHGTCDQKCSDPHVHFLLFAQPWCHAASVAVAQLSYPYAGDLRYAPAEIRISNFRESQNPARLQYKLTGSPIANSQPMVISGFFAFS
jgi:hypothetical protein